MLLYIGIYILVMVAMFLVFYSVTDVDESHVLVVVSLFWPIVLYIAIAEGMKTVIKFIVTKVGRDKTSVVFNDD